MARVVGDGNGNSRSAGRGNRSDRGWSKVKVDTEKGFVGGRGGGSDGGEQGDAEEAGYDEDGCVASEGENELITKAVADLAREADLL